MSTSQGPASTPSETETKSQSCPLCDCEFVPWTDGASATHCSDLCESYDSMEDQRFAGLDERPRELLIAITDGADEAQAHTDRFVELYVDYEISPDRIAQHTSFGDVTIRECLREAGSYRKDIRQSPGRELRAKLSDPDFGPEDLGLSPIGCRPPQSQSQSQPQSQEGDD